MQRGRQCACAGGCVHRQGRAHVLDARWVVHGGARGLRGSDEDHDTLAVRHARLHCAARTRRVPQPRLMDMVLCHHRVHAASVRGTAQTPRVLVLQLKHTPIAGALAQQGCLCPHPLLLLLRVPHDHVATSVEMWCCEHALRFVKGRKREQTTTMGSRGRTLRRAGDKAVRAGPTRFRKPQR